ncbi:hypothetical protein Rsub_10014 [Raphidocelis subcapitata]|uniref:Uncharacterized protein n=1 Tax=Raphidocelis subcapitata TaxID=307507 RepID=A0A2V0PHD6_9CHLO|nr:hypothetical protein Rsub_10014 [Raphidocelis subcapitata]|eukprot:GBF97323.1 hypothetical protein Rsub_10014 [Raphidocelis subcapitata]
METNCLIAAAHAELGKPRKITFANPGDRVFGLKLPPDAEGAKEVTMTWKEHTPNPHAKPPPDFRAMNKIAVDSGLTRAAGLREFRATHSVAVKSAEEVRISGPSDPPMRDLVGGKYAHAWVDMNAARADELDARAGYIKPAPTRATQGHCLGALRATAARVESDWKMPKFTRKATSRVAAFMGRTQGAAAAAAADGEEQGLQTGPGQAGPEAE